MMITLLGIESEIYDIIFEIWKVIFVLLSCFFVSVLFNPKIKTPYWKMHKYYTTSFVATLNTAAAISLVWYVAIPTMVAFAIIMIAIKNKLDLPNDYNQLRKGARTPCIFNIEKEEKEFEQMTPFQKHEYLSQLPSMEELKIKSFQPL